MEVEKIKSGREQLVITEIPYTMIGAGIGKFLNDVYALVESKKTNDIVDISNQSSKEGIRIVLELRRNTDVENLKNMLYKKTRLEDTFGVNMLAVASGRPETLGLKAIIENFLDFQFDINTRKYQHLLVKEQEKREIQEGLIKACDVIDLIIEILRGSKNIKQAKNCLVNGITEGIKFKTKTSERNAKKLQFTENQATAILEMRLYKLIGLEIEALQKEHETTLKNIAKYEDILENHSSMSRVITKELQNFRKSYARPRRTQIINAKEAVFEEKKFEEMEVVFLMDRFGYCRTVDVPTFERNRDAAVSENKYVIQCVNTDKLCLFTDAGRMHMIKVSALPYGKFRDKAIPIDNFGNYHSSEENLVYVDCLTNVIGNRLLFATGQAMFKQVNGEEFNVSKRTIAATKLSEDDKVIAVTPLNDATHVALRTKKGIFLRFDINEVPEKKKAALGVRGIKLSSDDMVEEVYLLDKNGETIITYNDKTISLNKLKLGHRDSKGTKLRI